MPDEFDPYHVWLGIPPSEQPPHHYRLLGLQLFEAIPEVIESAADRQMKHLRTFQTGPHSVASQRLLGEVSKAQICLLNPAKKQEYDEQLRIRLTPATSLPKALPVARALPAAAPSANEAESAGPSIVATPQPVTAVRSKSKKSSPLVALWVCGVSIAALVLAVAVFKANQPDPIDKSSAPSPERRPRPVATPKVPPTRPGKSLAAERTGTEPASTPASIPSEGTTAGEERDDNGLTLKLVWCPAGSFTMGSPTAEPGRRSDEGPVPVTLSHGFWLGKYEVTQQQWQEVMGTTPWRGKGSVKEEPEYPATYVAYDDPTSTDDAEEFCRKLTNSERSAGRLPATWEYDLPTEAQWEFASRTGKPGRYSFGENENTLGQYAWYEVNAVNVGENYAHQVGQKLANAWGLHDMHGNVFEWCRDAYAEKLPGGPDPRVKSGSVRVFRGGSWHDSAGYSRSASRLRNSPGDRGSSLGFRLARVPSGVVPVTPPLADATKAKPIQAEAPALAPAVPLFPLGEWVDVLSMIDPDKHAVRGEWRRTSTQLGALKPINQGRCTIPVTATGSYDFEVHFTLQRGQESHLVVPVGNRSCLVAIGSWGGRTAGLDLLDGRAANQNASTVKHEPMRAGQQQRVHCRIRTTGDHATFEVDLNFRPLIRWQGATSLLSLHPLWKLPNPQAFGLGPHESTITYHSARLKVVAGKASPL